MRCERYHLASFQSRGFPVTRPLVSPLTTVSPITVPLCNVNLDTGSKCSPDPDEDPLSLTFPAHTNNNPGPPSIPRLPSFPTNQSGESPAGNINRRLDSIAATRASERAWRKRSHSTTGENDKESGHELGKDNLFDPVHGGLARYNTSDR